jgi:4-hydroxybenzoate polyprenyltransferase
MTVVNLDIPVRVQAAALLRALRVHQWVKNLLVFVPVLLDHRLELPVFARAGLAFAAFCCAASGGYVLNDLLDVEADRKHKVKRNRPFAANLLSRSFGVVMVPLLFAAALLCSLWLSPEFLALLALYVVLTSAYSGYLKRVAVLDVILLAGLYTLRVLAGIAASQVRFSTWLLAFSMFLFLSLAFLKRYAELRELPAGASDALERRGYIRGDREWLISMGGASGYLSVLVLALYINSEEVIALYGIPLLLWLICPLLLFWISRMWMLAHRGQIDQDPIVAAVRDPASYVIGALVAVILYVSA